MPFKFNKIKQLLIVTALFPTLLSAGTVTAAGFGFLAVGARNEKVGTEDSAGTITVLHGSAQGVTGSNSQLWDQDSTGISGKAEASDNFSYAVVSGDFNNDGYPDLAAGVPAEDIGVISNAGAVNIIYGTSSGLTTANNQLLYQGSNGILGNPEENDQFGQSLAAGDFNGDGFTDLAVGSPYEDITTDIDTYNGAGAINIIYGSSQGLTAEDDSFLYEGFGAPGLPEDDDNFGWALAAADFNHDGFMDLAVAIKGAEVNGKSSAGEVLILYGSITGLSSAGNQVWQQGNDGLADTPEGWDHFGSSLAAGDFNNDTFADLAIGTPHENNATSHNVGAVNIIYGSATGLTNVNNQFWQQGSNGMTGAAEENDYFGKSLASGDFNHDGFADLAIGVPFEDWGPQNNGAVHIIYGSLTGLNSTGNQMWAQGHAGIAGQAEVDDNFGESLAAGDINNDGFTDLAIGVPFEDIGAVGNAGAVNIIYGSALGLSAANNQAFWQGLEGIPGTPEDSDLFGWSLSFLPGRIFSWPMFLPAITAHGSSSPPPPAPAPAPDPLTISSSSFNNNQPIPAQYSLLGGNISPQLSWGNVPTGTASFMLTVIDPDGGDWLHWKVKLPAATTALAENAGASGGANLPAGAIRYDNGFAGLGLPAVDGTDYDGPWPPSGDGVHHYNFKVTALDAGDNELGSATLTGTYEIP